MLLLASARTRPGLVLSVTNHNLAQVHLALGHEGIAIARCRQLHLKLRRRHTLASYKSATSNPSSCKIHLKSRVKNACLVLLGHSTPTQPDVTSYKGLSCAHVMMQ